MNGAMILALLPILILGGGVVVAMMVIAFWRNHLLAAGMSLVILALALISLPIAAAQSPGQVTPLLVMDSYAYFISGLLIAASFVVTLLGYEYLRLHSTRPEEFYLLLITATLGGVVLAGSAHFASFFLGLEILSISLYAMVGYIYNSTISVEAGMKYLILASSSAAFLLFGMALVYNELGTMEFAKIASAIGSGTGGMSVVLLTGFVMMLVAFGYKLALVPFHMWTPDVYEGAPAPVTAFVASVSKGSMFAVMLRFFNPIGVNSHLPLMVVFTILAVATMLAGSLLALLQNNLKRLLAYSSIANLGYLLVAFIAGGSNAVSASTFFLISYFITILAAFGVVTVVSNEGEVFTNPDGGNRDVGWLAEYRGLMWRRPWLAALLAISMFSLAGIPLTVGFVGKFYLVLAGVGSALWLLVVVLVISSAIGLFYYLRVVVALFTPTPEGSTVAATGPKMSWAGSISLAGLFVLIILVGIFPSPVIGWIQGLRALIP